MNLFFCAQEYCFYDEFNYDSSLDQAVFRYWDAPFAMRWSRASVLHIGTCGLNEGLKEQVNAPEKCRLGPNFVGDLMKLDYHDVVNVSAPIFMVPVERSTHRMHGWGGWSDPRDSMLCYYLAHSQNGTM